jgi:Anti-sigma factor NepR
MADIELKKGQGSKSDKKIDSDRMKNASAKPEVSDLIGERLRNYYNAVAEQPVPDRFMDLLNQLEAATKPKKPE